MEKITILNGKTHYKLQFSVAMLVLPEAICIVSMAINQLVSVKRFPARNNSLFQNRDSQLFGLLLCGS